MKTKNIEALIKDVLLFLLGLVVIGLSFYGLLFGVNKSFPTSNIVIILVGFFIMVAPFIKYNRKKVTKNTEKIAGVKTTSDIDNNIGNSLGMLFKLLANVTLVLIILGLLGIVFMMTFNISGAVSGVFILPGLLFLLIFKFLEGLFNEYYGN